MPYSVGHLCCCRRWSDIWCEASREWGMRMSYLRFSLVFVVIFLGSLVFATREVNWSLTEYLVFLGGLLIFGGCVVLVFFYRNRQKIEQYLGRPDLGIILEVIFGKRNRKKGGKPDA